MRREMVFERVGALTRLAVLEDGRLCEFFEQTGTDEGLTGNIYAGRVQNILPGMNAAFVDIGLGKNAFLAAADAVQSVQPGAAAKAQIEKLVRPGEMILCQVTKEPGGSKGPRISRSLTLPGRMSVLLPDIVYAGVSKKIEDAAERDRLYAIVKRVTAGSGSGMIVRTAAEGAGEDAIRADFDSLLRLWEQIAVQGEHAQSPAQLFANGSLPLKCVRDMLSAQVDRVRTDDPQIHRELEAHIRAFAPELLGRLSLETPSTPLFDLLRVDSMLEKAFRRSVDLKSGGTLVFDEAEALTAIDVNTARFTGNASQDETILKINLEAAREIARQLRLRDLGGIIIADFIDMTGAQDRAKLLSVLEEELANDRNRARVVDITKLGLVEITRHKVRPSLAKRMGHTCAACAGSGRELSHESTARMALREIWRRRRAGDTTGYVCTLCEQAAQCLSALSFSDADTQIRIRPGRGFTLEPAAKGQEKEYADGVSVVRPQYE